MEKIKSKEQRTEIYAPTKALFLRDFSSFSSRDDQLSYYLPWWLLLLPRKHIKNYCLLWKLKFIAAKVNYRLVRLAGIR